MKSPSCKLVAAVAVALASAAVAHAQALSIRTLAGATAPGATNSYGSNARFNHPQALAADGAGNIYVVDTDNSTVRKITPDGYAATLAGLTGSYGSADGAGASARFYGPQGLAADGAGQLYVADTANSTIRKVSAAGAVSTFAGVAGNFNSFDGAGANAQFYHPEGVATDAGGNLYVADTWNHTIRKITPAGQVSTLAGLAGNFGSADGTSSKARFYRPAAVAVDSATNVFVADSFNHTIRKITPAGQVSTIAGLAGVWGSVDGTNNAARFYLPQGISIGPQGELWVADTGNQALRRVSAWGTNWVVSTVAGLAGLAGSSNGTGSSAQFCFPAGLGSDNAGNLYIADSANNTIRTTQELLLAFSRLGNQLVLSWPVAAGDFVLEKSASLGTGADWVPVTDGIVTFPDKFVRTNSLSGAGYYRLHLP